MLEKTGKKIKTLKEHKEDVQRRTEDARKESSSRREAEENKERSRHMSKLTNLHSSYRQLAERNVRKWENNYTSEENNTDEKGLTVSTNQKDDIVNPFFVSGMLLQTLWSIFYGSRCPNLKVTCS